MNDQTISAEVCKLAVITELLKQQKNVTCLINWPNQSNYTPLEFATTTNQFRIAKFFIENGGNFRRENPAGMNLLHVAALDLDKLTAEEIKSRYEFIQYLIARDSTLVSQGGKTGLLPLVYAQDSERRVRLSPEMESSKDMLKQFQEIHQMSQQGQKTDSIEELKKLLKEIEFRTQQECDRIYNKTHDAKLKEINKITRLLQETAQTASSSTYKDAA